MIDPENLQRMATDPGAFRDALWIPGARGRILCGPSLADFQRSDFEAIDRAFIAVVAGREPTPQNLWIERTKGAAKSSDAAIALIHLAAFSLRTLRIVIAAGDELQADEVRRSAKAVLKMAGNEWLLESLDILEGRIVNRRTETTIEVLTADALGSHGSFPHVTLIDEVSHISRWPFVETLMDNAAKNPFGVLLCLTNAGFRDSSAFKLREIARQSEDWYFSALEVPAPWLSPKQIEERRQASTPSRFSRLWCGQWVAGTDGALSAADIEAAITQSGPMQRRDENENAFYVGAVDIGLKNDHSALVILQCDAEHGRVRLAHCESWKPRPGMQVQVEDVRRAIVHAHQQFGLIAVVFDPWQAQYLAQLLRADGIHMIEAPATPANLDAWATALLRTFVNRRIDLYRDDLLIADLFKLQIEERAKGFRLHGVRDAELGHLDRAIALSMLLPGAFGSMASFRRVRAESPEGFTTELAAPTGHGPRHGEYVGYRPATGGLQHARDSRSFYYD